MTETQLKNETYFLKYGYASLDESIEKFNKHVISVMKEFLNFHGLDDRVFDTVKNEYGKFSVKDNGDLIFKRDNSAHTYVGNYAYGAYRFNETVMNELVRRYVPADNKNININQKGA
jgi:hypothetical protein